MSDDTSQLALVFRVAGKLCALPLAQVVETLRPLPVRRFGGTPDFVLGAATVRGLPIPVVSAARLLDEVTAVTGRRWICVLAGSRRVALEVDDVLGVRMIDGIGATLRQPLLEGADPERIATLGRLDGELLCTLEAARLVPGDAWADIDAAGAVA